MIDRVLTPFRKNVLLVMVGCAVLPPLTATHMPQWLPESTALTLAIGVALAVAALSLNLLLGYAGQLSLGHAALLGAGAFVGGLVVGVAEAEIRHATVSSSLTGLPELVIFAAVVATLVLRPQGLLGARA